MNLNNKRKDKKQECLVWKPIIILFITFILQALMLMFGMQIVTFADYNVLYTWLETDSMYYGLYNFFLFLSLLILNYCLYKRVTPGYLILVILTLVVSVINNMKWVNLKECVMVSDFEKLSEALKVAEEAEFNMCSGTWICMVVGIAMLFICIFLDCKISNLFRNNQQWIRWCRIGCALLLVILVSFIVVDGRNSVIAKLTESRTAEETGPVVCFIESIFTTHIDEPYTVEEAEDSYYTYVEQGRRIVSDKQKTETSSLSMKPNVIVIMSEAFFDVNRFEGVLSYSENPMAYYEEIERESISGNMMVNIYGGSTHFSEFEFLTGWNSKGMDSGSCPYKEYFNSEQPSFAGYMKEQGYSTIAIHPYDSYFWNRKNAYPNMGFDTFIDRSRMKYTDMCGYISDDALTEEIIYRYEQREEYSDAPFFCMGVSIANHIAIINGEEKENSADHIGVTFNENVGYSEAKEQRVQQYISGISETGEALKKLTDYFKEQKEPTVVVFFGDHAPNYAVDILKAAGKEDLSYSTPYLIWSNYDMGEIDEPGDINVSYLSTYLVQLLGMPLTEQNFYNIALHSHYQYETRYEIENLEGEQYEEFSVEEKEAYFGYALDLKKQIPTLLENPKTICDIWDISSK